MLSDYNNAAHYSAQQAQRGLDLLGVLYHTQFLSDVQLAVQCAHSNELLFTLPMHRVILGAASLHFRRLLVWEKQGADAAPVVIRVDPQATPEPLVRLFFRLFYVTVFAAPHLDDTDREAIGENVLQLYELAGQYLFDPLRAYCERLLYGSFALDHFKLLSDYALRPDPHTGLFSVQAERMALYARFLQWFQCCTDDKNTHYTELQVLPRDTTTSSSDGEECHDGELATTTAGTIDRQYFSCNKREIVEELQGSVANIAQCRLPRCHVTPLAEGARHLEYYRRICSDCVRRGNRVARDGSQYSNIGCLRKHYSNGHEIYSFRLKRDHSHQTLELCVEQVVKRARYDDHEVDDECMQVEEDALDVMDAPLTNYRCDTELTLLSKRLCLSRFTATHEQHGGTTTTTTAQHTPVLRFTLDERDECYSGRCQSCRHTGPLYILLLRLSLVRLKFEPLLCIPALQRDAPSL